MSDALRAKLTPHFSTEHIDALALAMINATAERDVTGWTYANAMERAFDEHGVQGVKMQILYMSLYLNRWTGAEARATKKVIRKIAR